MPTFISLLPRPQDREDKPRVRQVFLTEARDRFLQASDAEADERAEMLIDEEFRASRMWPDKILADREARNKPCLTIDMISGALRQVTAAERQAKPAMHLSPDGGGADRASADAREGLCRAIQQDSQAEIAYDWAFEKGASIGLGWFYFDTEYESDDSFDQVIKICWVENTFAVYSDPLYQHPMRRDMRYLFLKSWVARDDFIRQYGEAKYKGLEDWSSTGDHDPQWFSEEDGVAVMKYFHVVVTERELAQLADGTTIPLEGISAADQAQLPIVDRRTAQVRTVKVAIVTATDVLEGNEDKTGGRDVPCKYIPFVPVEGERLNVDGKRILRGIIRPARDAQKMYNVLVSTGMEAIALTPKAAYVAAAGQVERFKEMWERANTESFSVLPYDPMEVGGVAVPAPQRQVLEPALVGIFGFIRQAANDLHTLTGFFDPTDPSRPNTEQSGRAIEARRQSGSQAHIGLMDNLQRSLTYGGELLNDMLARVYDRPSRVLRLLGQDDSPSLAQLRDPSQPARPGLMSRMASGVASGVRGLMGGGADQPPPMKTIDLKPGSRYAVVATVGASFSTRRQEVVSQMTELFKAYPPLAQVGMDILVSNMDGPGMKELSERLKKQLPPGILEDNPDEPVPASAQVKLQQQEQMIQAMQVGLEQATEIIQTKKLEIDGRERVAMIAAQSAIAVAMAKLGDNADRQRLEQQFELFNTLIDQLHEKSMAEGQQFHDARMATAQAGSAAAAAGSQDAQARALAGGQQAHDRGMAAQGTADKLALQTDAAGHAQKLATTPKPAPTGGAATK